MRLSSIAYKTVMAISGLFLCLFLTVHLLGNLALFFPESVARTTFNAYADFLTHLPPIKVAAYLTYFAVLLHAAFAFTLTKRNRATAGQRYAYSGNVNTTSWYTRWMGVMGAILLLFIIIHMWNFWYPYKYGHDIAVDANGNKDLYGIVVTSFASLTCVLFYVLAMVALGLHLYQGLHNGLRSLGLYHKRYSVWSRRLSKVFAIVVSVIFALMPIYIYLRG
ncbi:MAG TPA: succinate dehydrogenase [Planctomycetaceae bacterium]|nr:succinate dehydrogenase [Planctomycetaceae bacterium]